MKLRIFLYVLCLAGAVIFFFMSGPSSKSAQTQSSKKKVVAEQGQVDPTAYTGAAFAKPSGPVRDIFLPTSAVGGNGQAAQNMDKVPSDLAGGESGWVYTAYAELNGERMALLEGGPNNQSGYVQEGQKWKAGKVVRISGDSVLFEDKDGVRQTVLRYTPKEAADSSVKDATSPEAEAANQAKPVMPQGMMRGPIGEPVVGGVPVIVEGEGG